MFSGQNSIHIPLHTCSCKRNHCWCRSAGSHAPEHMHLNLERDKLVCGVVQKQSLELLWNNVNHLEVLDQCLGEMKTFLTWACFLIHVQDVPNPTLADVRVPIFGTNVLAIVSLGTCIRRWTWKEKLTPQFYNINNNHLAVWRSFGHSSLQKKWMHQPCDQSFTTFPVSISQDFKS